MQKRLIRTCSVVPLLAALAACGPYVRSDVNKNLIGSVHCGTFAWVGSFRGDSPLRSGIANPLNESRLRAAIAAHLGPYGIQPPGTAADCLVGYGIGSTYVVDAAWPYGYPYGYPYGPGWYGWGPYVYREVIIAVDLYDARSGQPLWHASADQSLYGVSDGEAEKRINAAVAAIFTKYPG